MRHTLNLLSPTPSRVAVDIFITFFCLLAAAKATQLAFQVFCSPLWMYVIQFKGPSSPYGSHRPPGSTLRWKVHTNRRMSTAAAAPQKAAQIDARRSQFLNP